jgi:hypothetical protein
MSLSRSVVKKLGALRPSYDKSAVFNVALLLVGARAAYLPDSIGFATKVRDMFPDRIGLIITSDRIPVMHRIGALGAASIRKLTKATEIPHKMFRQILGFTGTAFPCNMHADTVLIEWVFMDDGEFVNISNHCARPRELKACFDHFNGIRERAKALVGVKIGDIKMERMALVASPFDWASPP